MLSHYSCSSFSVNECDNCDPQVVFQNNRRYQSYTEKTQGPTDLDLTDKRLLLPAPLYAEVLASGWPLTMQ